MVLIKESAPRHQIEQLRQRRWGWRGTRRARRSGRWVQRGRGRQIYLQMSACSCNGDSHPTPWGSGTGQYHPDAGNGDGWRARCTGEGKTDPSPVGEVHVAAEPTRARRGREVRGEIGVAEERCAYSHTRLEQRERRWFAATQERRAAAAVAGHVGGAGAGDGDTGPGGSMNGSWAGLDWRVRRAGKSWPSSWLGPIGRSMLL